MTKPTETDFEYGVRYPDGTEHYITSQDFAAVPGVNKVGNLATAAGRGDVLDQWRNQLKYLGVDPDKAGTLTFIRRERVTKWSEPDEIPAD